MPSTSESLRHYLEQIGRVPLLDATREVELAKRIEAGRLAQLRLDAGDASPEACRAVQRADRAKDEFVRANLRLVVSIAKRYPIPPGMELLDLIQEGNLGLERAVDRFDWRKGFKFSTYASYWIRQAIGRSIDQHGSLIRVPSRTATQLRSALRATEANGRELDGEMRVVQRLTNPVSLDRPLGEDSSETLGDLVDSPGPELEDAVVERLLHGDLLRLLAELEPRRRRALELRIGLTDGGPLSFRQVGAELGVTSEAARRLVHRALEQLRRDAAVLVAA